MEVQERGYEGLVAKDESSFYVGGRTLSWLQGEAARLSVRQSRVPDSLTVPLGTDS